MLRPEVWNVADACISQSARRLRSSLCYRTVTLKSLRISLSTNLSTGCKEHSFDESVPRPR